MCVCVCDEGEKTHTVVCVYLISRKSAPYTVRAVYISIEHQNIRSISKFSRFQIFFPLIIPYHTHTTVVQTRNTHTHTHTHTQSYQCIK